MTKIALIDYGSGNLRSAAKAFEHAAHMHNVRADIIVTSDPDKIVTADRVVLPGVGAFADCQAGLGKVSGLIEVLTESITRRAIPFFGICVGMQLMATYGLEKQKTKGLDWISGHVVKINPSDSTLKIPHMGWNTLQLIHRHPVLADIPVGMNHQHAYFVHSYHIQPENSDHVLATTDYGGSITAIVGRDNMFGTQFHPEKSQTFGLTIIGNFLRWRP